MRTGARRRAALAFAAVLVVAASVVATAPAAEAPAFAPPVLLDRSSSRGGPGLPDGTEPRVVGGPDGRLWVMTSKEDLQPEAFVSDDGATWARRPFPRLASPGPDVDIVVTRTGRVIATALDAVAFTARTFYSDDSGATWTASKNVALVDQDRPWLAVGPDDPTTHEPRVYLLFHNLLSGEALMDMFVSTSRDGGATFGPPVPLALPGDPAFADLACGGSSGPSGIAVDQRTGRLYAAWGSRTSPRLGACGASVPPGVVGFSVMPSSRIWVATSPDGSAGSWRSSLAVDDAKHANTLGALWASIDVDRAGNVYVAYPETPSSWPNYEAAAVRYRWAPPGAGSWSAPVTVASGGAGHLAVLVRAGAPGHLAFAYLKGAVGTATWFATTSVTGDGLSLSPTFTETTLSGFPSYTGSASSLAGACGSGLAAGLQQGVTCPRATDNFGLTLTADCRLAVAWPAIENAADRAHAGSWVSVQSSGPSLCD